MYLFQNELVSREDTGRVLHLRGLTRASAGDYVCVATNREGTSSSRPVPLYVQCKLDMISLYRLQSRETCNVQLFLCCC